MTLVTVESRSSIFVGSRKFVQIDANNTETVLFKMSFALVPDGHKVEECNMMAYSGRSESVHILNKLHWCPGNVISRA